jgi:hypothetical protein
LVKDTEKWQIVADRRELNYACIGAAGTSIFSGFGPDFSRNIESIPENQRRFP